MNWKFWQKSGKGGRPQAKVIKLPAPKELPDRVGIHLITQMKEDPDWTWSLKWVVRRKTDELQLMEFKIFNPADAVGKGLVVSDFTSLDKHPEMVLFEGLFDKETGVVKIKKTPKAA